MGEIVELPTCPWCTAVINTDDTSRSRHPVDLNGTLWHGGCVEDLERGRYRDATLEEN